MRTLILAPVETSPILIGKNSSSLCLLRFFSAVLLVLNEIAFRDLIWAPSCSWPLASLSSR